MTIVKRVQELRLLKLRALIAEYFDGKPGHFADALGKLRPTIYRLFTDAQSRKAVGDSLAREIEDYFKQRPGWLDEPDMIMRGPEGKAVAITMKSSPKRDGKRNNVSSIVVKPKRMTAAFRKEVVALLEQMTQEQRDEVRTHMRQIVYDNVVSLKARQSTMQTKGIRIRSEGVTPSAKLMSTRRHSESITRRNQKGR